MGTNRKHGHLVIDVGGTLMSRSRPGTVQRAVDRLQKAGIDCSVPANRLAVARIVLTSSSPSSATEALIEHFGLPSIHRAEVHDALVEEDGEAVIFDGAAELLSSTRARGWTVVVATNAAAWLAPLPREIASHCDYVISSSDIGLIKQQLQFWRILAEKTGLDPIFTLVVGDQLEADIMPAQSAGFAAVKIDHRNTDLVMLRGAIEQAGPAPDECAGLAAGIPYQWAGRQVLDVSNLTTLVISVTRARIMMHTGGGTIPGEIVRRREQSPALVANDSRVTPPLVSWIRIRPDRRMNTCPEDLARALSDAGVSISNLPIGEQRQLIGMVREAQDPSIRNRRIADIVQRLRPFCSNGDSKSS